MPANEEKAGALTGACVHLTGEMQCAIYETRPESAQTHHDTCDTITLQFHLFQMSCDTHDTITPQCFSCFGPHYYPENTKA
jgi:Fe-S-cluster containining protein